MRGGDKFSRETMSVGLTLARLVALLGLVDDVEPAATADDAIVAMALSQRLERILDLHDPSRSVGRKTSATCSLEQWQIPRR
jgi:hypothetical protein